MKNSRPKVYGNCAAGCKWEVPHKEDFLSLKHEIGVNDWSGSEAPYTHSLTIDRVIDEDVILVDAPYKAYAEYGLAVEQEGSTVKFSVASLPAESVTINISVIPSTAVIEV